MVWLEAPKIPEAAAVEPKNDVKEELSPNQQVVNAMEQAGFKNVEIKTETQTGNPWMKDPLTGEKVPDPSRTIEIKTDYVHFEYLGKKANIPLLRREGGNLAIPALNIDEEKRSPIIRASNLNEAIGQIKDNIKNLPSVVAQELGFEKFVKGRDPVSGMEMYTFLLNGRQGDFKVNNLGSEGVALLYSIYDQEDRQGWGSFLKAANVGEGMRAMHAKIQDQLLEKGQL